MAIDSPPLGKETQASSHRNTLGRTLMAWFILLALLPMSLVAWIGYQQANTTLTQAAEDNLQQAADAKVAFLLNWFDYRFMDLHSQSENQHNVALLMQLKEGLQRSGNSSAAYVKSFDWARRVDVAQKDFITLTRHYDYIYDLFLIDTEGNILYTVAHESDLGANLFTGPLAGTRFARSVKTTLQTGRAGFSDLERYVPSNNSLAGFLTAPLLNELGDKEGVFAIQINLERVFKRIAAVGRGAGSRVHYLVGEDGLLRTAINNKQEEVLARTIATQQFQRWEQEPGKQAQQPDDQVGVASIYTGPGGQQVIGLHHRVSLPVGVTWILISEIDHDEALAVVGMVGSVTLALVILSGLLAAVLASYKAKSIVRPIIQLADASKAVAAGEIDQQVAVTADNEIGLLAEAFNHMLVMRQTHEKALEQSNRKTQQALADLAEQKFALDQHAIVAITDLQGTITFSNERFTKISGYSHEELLGKNHRILKSGLHDKAFFRGMYRTICGGEVWHGQICNRAKDGHHYWVDSTILPFKGIDGKPKSYISIRTDITQQKKGELALQEAKEVAESANRAKSEFLANMSHEIRTPMNGIIGMTNLLLDDALNHEQHARALTIKSSAESLLGIINDILDFSKIEAGKLDLELLDFDLGALMDDFAATLAFRADEKGLELICPANPVLHHWYRGDPGRIRQILTNLVGNALKFTEQGEVSVRYEVAVKDDDRTLLHFTVTDTGIGLSAEQQERLFERFTQADGSTTRQYGGTGLGLSICKQLVEMMDGEIGVKSSLGEGATFWFTLDLANAEARSPPRQASDLHLQKVLVVDDNATNRDLLDQVLYTWQVEHGLAATGPAALRALNDAVGEGRPYSIALIDMQMPGMDGVRLGATIQDNVQLAATRMVLFTSQGRRGDAKKMQQAGFTGYLNKPINQSELYNALLQVAGITNDGEQRLITRYTAREIQQFNARVLVVEDNIANQAVAQGMLKKFGIHIDLASNGKEALHALQQLPYDLVFMDCQMPVMDGYDATRRIRDRAFSVQDHTIPVIAMTANAMQGDRDRCLAAGMDDHITKPVDPSKLHLALQRWLPESCRQAASAATAEERAKDLPASDMAHNHADKAQLPAQPVFDYAAMSGRLMGDDSLVRTVAETFLTDMSVQIKQLKSVVAAGGAQQVTSQAHKIKGAAANVGGMALSAQARKMEQAGKTGELEAARQGLPELEQRFTQLKAKMEETLF